jgi:hypothetical protein
MEEEIMPKKKATQEELPGMEARDVPEIEQAAENYRKIRDERCELSKRESEAKAALIQVMKNLGRSFYQYNGLKVQLEITDNVKVKSSDDGDEEPTGTFTSRKRQVKEKAEELIERQHAEADVTEEERERLHREAVATWRRERPASVEDEAVRDAKKFSEIMGEEGPDSDAEWFASLTVEEREKYYAAPCKCGHSRDWHGEEDKDICERGCGVCAKCKQYHCPVCDTKGGHQATCEHYVLGEGTPVQQAGGAQVVNLDDFTAQRCDECKRIDGGHTKECSKNPDRLTSDDYLAFAQAHYKTNHQSHARKMALTGLKDDEIRMWKLKQQQAGNGVATIPTEGSPDPRILCWCKHKYADHRNGTFCRKKNCGCNSFSWAGEPEPEKKGAKLSPVEAAIDR